MRHRHPAAGRPSYTLSDYPARATCYLRQYRDTYFLLLTARLCCLLSQTIPRHLLPPSHCQTIPLVLLVISDNTATRTSSFSLSDHPDYPSRAACYLSQYRDIYFFLLTARLCCLLSQTIPRHLLPPSHCHTILTILLVLLVISDTTATRTSSFSLSDHPDYPSRATCYLRQYRDIYFFLLTARLCCLLSQTIPRHVLPPSHCHTILTILLVLLVISDTTATRTSSFSLSDHPDYPSRATCYLRKYRDTHFPFLTARLCCLLSRTIPRHLITPSHCQTILLVLLVSSDNTATRTSSFSLSDHPDYPSRVTCYLRQYHGTSFLLITIRLS
ncbi:hypothetical protein J6590_039947 [Homalodisca vitripennis]|nr:hypothetical protein J6590_039947 [Homalodisca vitripennis]